MEDEQIYELAGEILSDITHDLNEGIYAELGGRLSIAWSTNEIYGAYASSLNQSDKPPEHCITVYYEFARQLWRDIEDMCRFLRTVPRGSWADAFYHTFADRATLPTCFNAEDQVRNMFAAALTWVYFHELGHLMQEHGIIRREFGPEGDGVEISTDVHDCEVSHRKPISGREALVSHVTELAADFEATNSYVEGLLRHIVDPRFVSKQQRPEVFLGTLYLMVCGLSLVFFRFNGREPILPVAAVEGTHPKPLTRLEILLPQIWENLDWDLFRTEEGHSADREQLVKTCTKAAFSAALYWSTSVTNDHNLDPRFLLKGVLSNLDILQYLQPIIEMWDEMLPRIEELRRYGPPRSLMRFTNEFRNRITKVIFGGSGPEAKATATAFSPPDAEM